MYKVIIDKFKPSNAPKVATGLLNSDYNVARVLDTFTVNFTDEESANEGLRRIRNKIETPAEYRVVEDLLAN